MPVDAAGPGVGQEWKGAAMLQLLKTCYLNGYFVLRLWFKLTHSASSAGSRKIAQKKEKEKDDFYVFLFLFEANEVVLCCVL